MPGIDRQALNWLGSGSCAAAAMAPGMTKIREKTTLLMDATLLCLFLHRGDMGIHGRCQNGQWNGARFDHRIVEVPQVEPRAQFLFHFIAQAIDLGMTDLIAAGLARGCAIAVD